MDSQTAFVARNISVSAALIQLAEEAAELSAAAAKMARIVGGDNPAANNSLKDAHIHVMEEFADVLNAAAVCGIVPGNDAVVAVRREKMQRWVERLKQR